MFETSPISLKFHFLEQNQIDIRNLIISNQNILRYMKYLTREPLSPQTVDDNGDIIDQPDINLDDSVINNIILRPFDSNDIVDESTVKLFFNESSGNLEDFTIGKNIYILDIVIPLQYWILEGQSQKRNIRIADEFSKMVDNQYIAGIGKVFITGYKTSKINNNYGAFSLFIKIDNSSIDSEYPIEE